MKKMTLPIAIFVAILGCVLAVSANVTTMKIHGSLRQEQFKRIKAEQQLQAAVNDIRLMKQQLTESRNALDGIRAILDSDRNASDALQAQLNKMKQEKKSLESQVNTLMQQKQAEAAAAADVTGQ